MYFAIPSKAQGKHMEPRVVKMNVSLNLRQYIYIKHNHQIKLVTTMAYSS